MQLCLKDKISQDESAKKQQAVEHPVKIRTLLSFEIPAIIDG